MSAPANAHGAIVLAAGGSRRLGTPKQLLTRDGETLVHRAVRLAAETGPRRLVVVLGANHREVTAACADLDGEHVLNPEWESGLASSLLRAAGVLFDHCGPVLILGCDQPAMGALHLRQLLAGAASAASCCAATVHGATLGSPAVITSELLRDARRLVGDRGFGRRLSELPADTVWRLDATELQLDIDTEADVKMAIELGLLDAGNARTP